MGGDDGAKAFNAMDPNARCIATSGCADSDVMAHHASYGFCATLTKPFAAKVLGDTLDRVLRHRPQLDLERQRQR
ncbi:MAG: hypothetical protein ACFCBW_01610 [Candidatus Competibacterales bacterium]